MPGNLERVKAALADRYTIERELGAGGMATVYLARDVKHDRPVAVKVLRPELAASLGADRFLREIQVTAKLSHPHILPLYDSGEAHGCLYYVMPFVEGESLADLISREKQLPIPDAVRITREVAEALGHAHSYGLVHRDIKPQNILLSGGHAVVADFGIARAISAAGGEKLTQTGMAVGTPAYMSPEQAAGDENLDGRSDIYSLGCVLYELLVGQIPFTGPTPQAILARHSMDQVPPPHIMRDTIPDELEDVILTALAKSPADRFRTAQDFAEALMTLDSGAVAQRRASRATVEPARRPVPVSPPVVAAVSALGLIIIGLAIWQLWPQGPLGGSRGVPGGFDARNVAVLYFKDLSPGGALAYVADGLTEGLIDELSQVRALDVISRHGVARYRDLDLPRDSIARALQVGSLVEGSIEPAGDRVRAVVRLVDGESGADIERTSFELPATQVLAIQDSLVERVSRFLRARLGEEVRLRERRAGTSSVEAWTLAQRAERLRKDAEALVHEDDAHGAFRAFHTADSILALAEAADPAWVEPIVLRGWIAYRRARLAHDPHELADWLDVGLSHAERALTLAATHPAGLELRGTVAYARWVFLRPPDPGEATKLLASARADLETATRGDPTLASAFSTLSHLYYQIQDVPAAVLAARRAYEEDAFLDLANEILWRLFGGSLDLEQFAQAQRWCDEGARRFPRSYRFVTCRLQLMTTPAIPADVDRAWQLLARLDSLVPEHRRAVEHAAGQMMVGGVIARAGVIDSARAVLSRARLMVTHEVDPGQELLAVEAYMRTLLEDHDEAVELLKRYAAANPGHFDGRRAMSWWWRDLHGHPAFQALLGTGR